MVDIERANAYSEVLEILKYLTPEDYDKIPKEKYVNDKIKMYKND